MHLVEICPETQRLIGLTADKSKLHIPLACVADHFLIVQHGRHSMWQSVVLPLHSVILLPFNDGCEIAFVIEGQKKPFAAGAWFGKLKNHHQAAFGLPAGHETFRNGTNNGDALPDAVFLTSLYLEDDGFFSVRVLHDNAIRVSPATATPVLLGNVARDIAIANTLSGIERALTPAESAAFSREVKRRLQDREQRFGITVRCQSDYDGLD